MARTSAALFALAGLLLAVSSVSAQTCFKAQAQGANAGKADFHMSVAADFSTATFTMKTFSNQQLTMAHLHQGAAGVNGPPVVGLVPLIQLGAAGTVQLLNPPITVEGDIVQSGTFDAGFLGATLFGQSLSALVQSANNGTIYLNWHNVANPAGFIRGQLQAVPANVCNAAFPTMAAVNSDATFTP